MPAATGAQPLPQRRPVMPPMDGPADATKTQPIGEPVPERPSPQTPPPAPAGTVAEAAQVHARQTRCGAAAPSDPSRPQPRSSG